MPGILADALPLLAASTDFPDPTRIQLWDQGVLKEFLSAGGELRGLAFDQATNSFTLQQRFVSDAHRGRRPEVLAPVFVSGASPQDRLAEATARVDEMIALRRDARAVHAGMALHECAEAALVEEVGLAGTDRRWFCEGVANYAAWATLKSTVGQAAAATFLKAYDPAPFAGMAGRAGLAEWVVAEDEPPPRPGGDPAGPDQPHLTDARYAFATQEVFALAERHGTEMIRNLLAALRTEGHPTMESVYQQVHDATGEDLRARIIGYSAETGAPRR
jgi:hypothetical protein